MLVESLEVHGENLGRAALNDVAQLVEVDTP
jgi:hypothetical protein